VALLGRVDRAIAAQRLRAAAGVERAAGIAAERAAGEAERRARFAAEVPAVALLARRVDRVVAAAGQGGAVGGRGCVVGALREERGEVFLRAHHRAGDAEARLRAVERVEELRFALREVS